MPSEGIVATLFGGGSVPIFDPPRPVSIGSWTADEPPATSSDVAGAGTVAGSLAASEGGGGGTVGGDSTASLSPMGTGIGITIGFGNVGFAGLVRAGPG